MKHDHVVITDTITKPWLTIAGDNQAGRFSKLVVTIKTIDFSS